MPSVPFRPFTRRTLVALATGLLLPLAGAAPPAASDVLAGDAVTEANVVAALEPPPLMRDFQRRPVPSKPRSTSLLITFETNSARLTAAAMQQLDVVAGALRNGRLSRYAFNVEGHADPRGSHEMNLMLSKLRADAVRGYLVRDKAIEPSRLVALGKGDQELLNVADPTAPENRRVTFVTQPLPEPADEEPKR